MQEEAKSFGDFENLLKAKEEYRRLYLGAYIWETMFEYKDREQAIKAYREIGTSAKNTNNIFIEYIVSIVERNQSDILFIDRNIDKLQQLCLYFLYGDWSLEEKIEKSIKERANEHSIEILKEYGICL